MILVLVFNFELNFYSVSDSEDDSVSEDCSKSYFLSGGIPSHRENLSRNSIRDSLRSGPDQSRGPLEAERHNFRKSDNL